MYGKKSGNLITNPYKEAIQYNFLNLPRLVTKGEANISIRYSLPRPGGDASGRKWSQTRTEGIREYVGGIEYVDQKIQSVQHGEGRLVATYNAGSTAIESIRAEYWRQDHLGNTRVAFSDFNLDGVIATKDDPNTTENDVEITQENHYYPFGLNHEGPWYQTVQPKNKYTYNGKEYVEDLGLNWNDYGARWYDAAVGRWWAVDPMADVMSSHSPFNYTFNNPIRFIDPFGAMPTTGLWWDEQGDHLAGGVLDHGRLREGSATAYIVNAHPNKISNSLLISAIDYANSIFTKNGLDNIKFKIILKEEALKLKLNWDDLFLEIQYRQDDDIGKGGYSSSTNGITTTYDKNNNGLSSTYVNLNFIHLKGRKGESLAYGLGYLIAHELLHQILYHTNYRLTGDWKTYNSVEHHFDAVAGKHIPNLNMDGNILHNWGGRIPIGPSRDIQPAERIYNFRHQFLVNVFKKFAGKI